MNKLMILAILVAYKPFNDKSLIIVTDERVYRNVIVDNINGMSVTILSQPNDDGDIYAYTINISSIIGIQFADHTDIVEMK